MTTVEQWTVFGAFALIALVVLLAAAFAGAGRFGELPEPVSDQFLPATPSGPITPADLLTARFATVGRGYSQAQVDRLLALAAREWERERLQRQPAQADQPHGWAMWETKSPHP